MCTVTASVKLYFLDFLELLIKVDIYIFVISNIRSVYSF